MPSRERRMINDYLHHYVIDLITLTLKGNLMYCTSVAVHQSLRRLVSVPLIKFTD